jgi:catechol 2,3-dioxygenase-like lactoylglutathione lyase family enzyme
VANPIAPCIRVAALVLALAPITFGTLAQAQPNPAPMPPEQASGVSTQSPPLNGIAHIAIRVKDVAASSAFYQKLGFAQPFSMTKGDVVTQAFLKINDRQYIELYPTTPRDPQPGFLHLCFEGADLNALHDFYVAEGLTPIAVRKAGAGNLLFTMKGPLQYADPQNIEYTQYMPGSRHSNDFGKDLGPDRVADRMVAVTLAMQDPASARAFYLDKLRFTPAKEDDQELLALPGDSHEAVEIVPVSKLGPRSSITLSSPDIRHTGELLKSQGILFDDADGLFLTDPDGNTIRIVPQPNRRAHTAK